MCEHRSIVPIVEKNEKCERVVYSIACQDCFREFPVSPMALSEYLILTK